MKKNKIRDIAYISAFSAFLVLCSWISVPAAVPFTMQTFGVFLASGLLGAKRGTIAVLVYIFLGTIGLPVFSGGRSGIGTLLSQTGGYISGFLICTFISGRIMESTKKTPAKMAFAMIAGLFSLYIFGSLWFSLVYLKDSSFLGLLTILTTCVLPFVLPDALKIALAVFVVQKVSKHIDFRR